MEQCVKHLATASIQWNRRSRAGVKFPCLPNVSAALLRGQISWSHRSSVLSHHNCTLNGAFDLIKPAQQRNSPTEIEITAGASLKCKITQVIKYTAPLRVYGMQSFIVVLTNLDVHVL